MSLTVGVTGIAQREAWRKKILPSVEQVIEGVWSVPVVFPGNPMRYTLSYVLVDGDECLVVDPGFDSPEGYRQLRAGLARADVRLSEVSGVVATHFHPDHLGMARRLADDSGAWIGLGRAETRNISIFDDAQTESEADQARMRGWGVPEDRIPEAAMDIAGLMQLRRLADPDLRLGNGEAVPFGRRGLKVVETPGHTPGHICLRDAEREIILTGDHILPRISPNVSLEIRGDMDPLRKYLDSLRRIEGDDQFEVLPAHEYRFRGLAQRARTLREHALERLSEVLRTIDALPDPTVWSVATLLSWSRGFDSLGGLQLRLALSETAAHLQYLATSGVRHGVPGLPVS